MNSRHTTVQPDITKPSRARRWFARQVASLQPVANWAMERCLKLKPLGPLESAAAVALIPALGALTLYLNSLQ